MPTIMSVALSGRFSTNRMWLGPPGAAAAAGAAAAGAAAAGTAFLAGGASAGGGGGGEVGSGQAISGSEVGSGRAACSQASRARTDRRASPAERTRGLLLPPLRLGPLPERAVLLGHRIALRLGHGDALLDRDRRGGGVGGGQVATWALACKRSRHGQQASAAATCTAPSARAAGASGLCSGPAAPPPHSRWACRRRGSPAWPPSPCAPPPPSQTPPTPAGRRGAPFPFGPHACRQPGLRGN